MLRSSFRRPSDGAFQRLEENNPSDEKKVLFLSVEGANTERHYFECLKILMGKSGDFTFHIEVLKREGSEGYSAPKYVIELLEEYMDVRDHGPLSEDWMRRIEAEYSPKTLKQLLEKNHGSELTPEEKCICEGLLDEGLDLIYRRYLSKMGSRKGDIYVAVIDRESSNNRREALLRYIQNCGNKEYKLYLTNPCFEFWLLLHLCDVKAEYKDKMTDLLENKRKTRNHTYVSFEVSDKAGHAKSITQETFDNKYFPNIPTAIGHAKDFAMELTDILDNLGTNLPELFHELGFQSI